MHATAQKEQFSLAFIHAVTTVAGFEVRRCTVDVDSVDLEIIGTRAHGTTRRAPHLEVQAKCTERDNGKGPTIAFALPQKNYDDLRDPQVHVARVLVVLAVPDDVNDWLKETPTRTAMKRCAYWMSLRGMPATGNETATSVHLPRASRFTVAALHAIMGRIGAGGTP